MYLKAKSCSQTKLLDFKSIKVINIRDFLMKKNYWDTFFTPLESVTIYLNFPLMASQLGSTWLKAMKMDVIGSSI